MTIATREQLLDKLGREKRRYRDVDLPVCGATVRIRSLTEGELSAYQRKMFAKNGRGFDGEAMKTANRRLFVLCLVDEQGTPLLGGHDAEQLTNMDSADSSTLYEACAEHCGIDRTDLGDLGKNSDETDADSSPSD